MSGVLNNSSVIRNKHLQQNLSLYEAYDGISKRLSYYAFNTKPLKRINGGSLYNYTHNELTDYSKNIGHLYFKHRPDFQPYINIDPINPQNFWGGEYHDYYDYVNTVYTQISPPIQFIEGLLSTQFLDEAIRVTSPAIVHNPEPTLSMAGVVKTNVNNFSGTDTRTGLLGNQMYAHALYHGANFNSMRKGTATFAENHITPSVYGRFGNSNNTINSLSSIVSALRADGKIIEDYNSGIGIIHNVEDIIEIEDALKTLQEKENAYQKEKEAYQKAKEQYKKDLKEYNKGGKQGTKPTKPEKPIRDTSIQYTDINPTNLFKTLALNNYFDSNTKKFKPYGGTQYMDGNSRSGYDFSPSEILGKNDGITQHIVYNDNNPNKQKLVINGLKLNAEEVDVPDAQDYITEFDNYIPLDPSAHNISNKSLLYKTNKLFQEHKINTIYGTHSLLTDEVNNIGFGNFVDTHYKNTTIDTSTTSEGRSRGRNLKAKKVGEIHGLDNPFCRTWTYHHQYDRMDKLIRPLSDDEGNLLDIRKIQALNARYRTFMYGSAVETGDIYLAQNTVLNDNGMVNIAPSKNEHVDIKKCMFSIENLAWKDVLDKENYLSKEQRGPNGGRIMWFPPYDLNFSENTNVNWEQSTFIGRGEKMYTYSNTDRNGTLSFTLLIDHPSTIHNVYTEGGNVRNNITDEDILRFFAGCGPLDVPEEITTTGGTTPIIPPIEQEVPKKTTEIYVYFPNNYSGHYTSIVKSAKEDTTTPPDDDFVDYMVYGYNAEVSNGNSSKQRGYEMLPDNKGLTIKDTNDGTFFCCDVDPTAYKECKKDGTIRFYYRTDFDLKQNGLNKQNYKDSSSYQLNSKNGQGDFVFANLIFIYKQKKNEGFVEFKNYIKNIIGEESFSEFEEKCTKLYNILSDTENIVNISLVGSATDQDSLNAKMLANRRGATLKHLITNICPELKDKFVFTTKESATDSKNKSEINTEPVKRGRYSSIQITYKVAKTELAQDNTEEKEKEKETDSSKISIRTNKEYIRYEDEGQYFSKLQKTGSFLYKKLTTKFKYFTPAFHSVSPEGFNARLTFLQQCTRQGHTIEPKISSTTADKATEIAGNLSFGRMPVCILRIGDFIYSRVIITSMSINYGDNQWDLNPEGIGVQPMMAKVNLGITILGGQSLEGPISRLQNAITFNHYANAGVYDNRADRAKPNGEPNKWSTNNYYTWEPEFNDGSNNS
jgi:hypothetical protein